MIPFHGIRSSPWDEGSLFFFFRYLAALHVATKTLYLGRWVEKFSSSWMEANRDIEEAWVLDYRDVF